LAAYVETESGNPAHIEVSASYVYDDGSASNARTYGVVNSDHISVLLIDYLFAPPRRDHGCIVAVRLEAVASLQFYCDTIDGYDQYFAVP
jgi:hypothetical protein